MKKLDCEDSMLALLFVCGIIGIGLNYFYPLNPFKIPLNIISIGGIIFAPFHVIVKHWILTKK